MIRWGLITVYFLAAFVSVSGQELYMSRDVRNAFQKGTRSHDGRPGKNYWQNRGRYDIKITANPPDRTIRGREEITYYNNSNDTIRNPVFKLYLNIHKPGAGRQGDASANYLTDGMHIDSFKVNDKPTPWKEPVYHVTWQSVQLSNPLLPKDSVHFSFEWHFDVSVQSGREGMLDSTTYFLAYFYPRVAVFDDYNGWDRMNFVEAQEFYNDFNDYSLTVSVPRNYVVWATGTLVNPDKVLQPDVAKKLERSMKEDSIIHIATLEEMKKGTVTVQNEMNEWRWKADHITDVAIALSDHYVWDASSVIVDSKTKRRASVQAAYNENAKDFHYMVGFGKHALHWLSNNWPGVPYPFPKTTIVHGSADMEYPMMVNDGSFPDTNFSRFVVEHEIAHTWFPFYMGINETRYGFMDEGWATALEYLINTSDMGAQKADGFFKQFRVQNWINDPSAEQDLPIIIPANVLSGMALGNNEYGKAALGYLAVKDLLGDELFRKCLHAFMDRWNGKHPIPWDFFNTFNDISGKNLNWFWNSWYFSNNYIDLAIDGVVKTSKGYEISLSNIGGMPAPVNIIVSFADGTTGQFHQTPGIWEKNFKKAIIPLTTNKTIRSVRIDGGIFMDADTANNTMKAM